MTELARSACRDHYGEWTNPPIPNPVKRDWIIIFSPTEHMFARKSYPLMKQIGFIKRRIELC